jgi:hypothetical protein
MPDEFTPDTDGKLQATLEQGNAMNPLGKLLAKVTLDTVESRRGHDAQDDGLLR